MSSKSTTEISGVSYCFYSVGSRVFNVMEDRVHQGGEGLNECQNYGIKGLWLTRIFSTAFEFDGKIINNFDAYRWNQLSVWF